MKLTTVVSVGVATAVATVLTWGTAYASGGDIGEARDSSGKFSRELSEAVSIAKDRSKGGSLENRAILDLSQLSTEATKLARRLELVNQIEQAQAAFDRVAGRFSNAERTISNITAFKDHDFGNLLRSIDAEYRTLSEIFSQDTGGDTGTVRYVAQIRANAAIAAQKAQEAANQADDLATSPFQRKLAQDMADFAGDASDYNDLVQGPVNRNTWTQGARNLQSGFSALDARVTQLYGMQTRVRVPWAQAGQSIAQIGQLLRAL